MTAHRDLQDGLIADHNIPDPGAGQTINVDRDSAIVDLVTVSGGGTRVLGVPPRSGLTLTLNLKTDGADAVITQTSGAFNAAGNTTITLDDAGDQVSLISADIGGTLYWRVPGNGAAYS